MQSLWRYSTVALASLCWVWAGCGSRTALDEGNGGAGGVELGGEGGEGGQPTFDCLIDADCLTMTDACNPMTCAVGFCEPLPPVVCDDSDPCTDDRCVPETGSCEFTPVSFDLDRDGFKGPRPGKKAGEPGSCGDDCDDTSPLAFPGGQEFCDGVDNDCNGVVDDEAKYVAVGAEPTLVSEPGLTQAYAAGLAYGGPQRGYFATYTGEEAANTGIYSRLLDAVGQPLLPIRKVNGSTGDAIGGPSVWTGDRYGSVWSDRRDGDYEIYFNTFGPDGAKLGPDLPITNIAGFSLNPQIAWNGSSFFVVWQDEAFGEFEIYGQKIALDGTLLGPEEFLAAPVNFGDNAEVPAIAASSLGVGVVHRLGNTAEGAIVFQPFNDQWVPQSEPVTLASGANYIDPAIVSNGDGFIVVWGQKQPFRIFGAAIDFKGNLLVSPRELSPEDKAPYRRPLALPLGDRIIVAYSRQQDDGYELFSRTFSAALDPLSPPQELTQRVGDDLAQALLFGPDGDVAVYFDGKLEGPGGLRNAAFLTRLRCDASKP